MNSNDTKPEVSHRVPENVGHTKAITLEISVRDKANVQTAWVYYKRKPANHEWIKMEMGPSGDNRYQANLPLTPEGILYYFKVVDEDGNTANYLNFLMQTPYFVVDSWDPAKGN